MAQDSQVPPATEAPNYNHIFETLIPDPSSPGLEEMVSYFIYKRAKREWATKFYKRIGHKPDEAHLVEYVESYTESRLNGITSESQQIVASFAQSIIDEVRPQITEEALKERNFVRDAGVAAFGAAIYTLVLIVLALFAKFAHIDIVGIVESIFPVK